MEQVRFIIRISRPRFWIYIFGPYLVGLAAGASGSAEFLLPESLVFALYFLLPANLLVYGINDIFDYETDRRNPKKAGYEMAVSTEKRRGVWPWIAALNIPFIAACTFLAPRALPSLAGFLFFSVLYSAPPVRAKEVPFLDSVFNILYILPGAFAYQMLTGSFPPLIVMLAAGLWAMAMHAYSAVPDIEADKQAGVATIATKLGATGTHLFCIGCYFAAIISCVVFAPPLMLLGLVYIPLMRYSSYAKNRSELFRIYQFFPYINVLSGFALFWYVSWQRFF